MNIYSFLSVVVFTLTTTFGILAYIKLKRNLNSVIFLLVSFSLGLYSLGYSFSFGAQDIAATRYWYRISLTGLVLLQVFILLLSLVITNPGFRLNMLKIFLLGLPACILIYRNFTTDLYAVSFTKIHSLGASVWIPKVQIADIWSVFLVIYSLVYALYAFSLFLNWRKNSDSKRVKKITRLILLSVLFVFPFIIFTNVIAPAYKLTGVVDIAHLSSIVVYFAYYYAIHKYSFMKPTPEIAVDNIISSAKEIIILTDSDNKIISVNNNTLNLIGTSAEEVAGKDVSGLFIPNETLNDYLKSSRNPEDEKHLEAELVARENDLIPISFSLAQIMDEFNEPMAKILLGTDRSDKIRLKGLLETREKLISIIAHDLRGPIGNALAVARALYDNDGITDDEYEELKKIQINSLVKTLDLLEDLLLWARSGKDIRVNAKINFDLSSVLEENISLLKPSAQSKKINLTFDVPRNYNVFADKNMISTVIRNLLSNAIKFTPENGAIHCRAIGRELKRGISIIDNGKGIDKSQIELLFGGDGSNGNSSKSGSGLGLVVCREFIEKNDGIIWAERGPEEGSRFSFILPASENLN